ncbi:MAG: nucleoside hydrolase [Candidatus Latescibacteria bacterium]|nr:nucleoside hydrolase [Candidatus Latescibacterota bacterium]
MKRTILDTDPGVDDALAILLALGSPELHVVGISAVSGNVELARCVRNALRVLRLTGRMDLPVHAGASRPLIREPFRAEIVHGRDGLGDAGVSDAGRGADSEDAVGFLVRTLRADPGAISLVATGPLTNLALAERQSPGVLKQAREVIVMGGAVREQGNATPTGEFNFVADPHAAREVLHAGANLTLVPLDVTHRCLLAEEAVRRRIAPLRTPVSDFIARTTALCRAYMKNVEGVEGFHLHDPLAVGVGIDPSFCETEVMRLDVETEGGLTAGQVVADRRVFVDERLLNGSNVRVCVGVDRKRFVEFFLERVLK